MPSNDKFDTRWSPFDPEWYQDAFDKFINAADMLFNQNAIIEQGYTIPDADGSRSSVFRNEAKLNNSFNEKALRDVLKDIYLNSSNRLVASNHDNTHFFQWHGNMSDMTIIPNTNYCQFSIPTENFIYPNERDQFKLSQFYRKWIKVEDILNNWNIFKWHCMLFIDQRVYSEYELRIDDREVTIKFRYYDFWFKQNYPVYIYKFDTNASCRMLISNELCTNQWNWKMPVSYITDQRVANASNVVVAINKISDASIRQDGETSVEVLGDNLEFLHIKDGYLDLSEISDFNRAYIMSERHEWLWISLIVPKFFHEYPILLPTDVIYQPYEANFQPVVSFNYDIAQNVKGKISDDSEYSQVYVDLNDELKKIHNGWKQLIRPIVLTDAFDENYVEPYDRLLEDVNALRDVTVEGADIIEKFRFFVKDCDSDDALKPYCSDLRDVMNRIRECMHSFLDKLYIEYNQEYELLYKRFLTLMDEIDEQGIEFDLFRTLTNYEREDRDFWTIISPLIYIPRELADKYYVINIIHGMRDDKVLWEDIASNLGKVRFQRPIGTTDFWTFEYDADNQVWRPYPLSISRHFPDVYIPKDPTEDTPSLNRIFKAFFFYSDTMNVLEESNDMIRPTQTWDEDIEEYHIDQGAIYRDIFMEKFYWMGMRAIYKGILVTNNRWEVIEYTIDNSSYERFNQLFLNTMDPYFKLGLATYLRSANFEFPFDDAIDKMKESIDSTMLGYKRVTNFELYLNKTWIPSYFDYIVKIMDDWDYEGRLLRRPRSTFDIARLLPILVNAQSDVYEATRKLVKLIEWILEHIAKESYGINVQNIIDLKNYIDEMYDNISTALSDTQNLDLHIYSIDEVNSIIARLKRHMELTEVLRNQFQIIYDDVVAHNIHEEKRSVLDEVQEHINTIPKHIDEISKFVNDFNMNTFMSAANELQTYFEVNKDNPDDNSLLGHINKFNDAWTDWVKSKRNKLFVSTTELCGYYDPEKLYEDDEVVKFIDLVNTVRSDISDLRQTIDEFYEGFGYEIDQEVYDKFDHVEHLLGELEINLNEFMTARDKLVDEYETVKQLLDSMNGVNPTEESYRDDVTTSVHNVIRHLSYIAGESHKGDATESYNEAVQHMRDWFKYNDTEKEVFDNLILLADPPIEILVTLEKHHDLINNMADYMDTVNIAYIPDGGWPTYSDVYRATEIEIVTKGFEHQVGDMVFVPSLGSYRITSVSGGTNQAELVEDCGYRNTTFRNPMTQYRPYDSITNGVGMGITIKPTTVEHKRIINDEVVESTIMRVESSARMIAKDLTTFNPYNNRDLQYVLNDIASIKDSWDSTAAKFKNYVTAESLEYTDKLVDSLLALVDLCNSFMNTRDKIIFSEFIKLYQDYIYDSYNYTESAGLQNETFFYYDEIIRTSYNTVCDFYGSGTTWSDGKELRALLIDTARPIRVYYKQVFGNSEDTDEIVSIRNQRDELISTIDGIVAAIDQIPVQLIDLEAGINRINTTLGNAPVKTKDVWYRLKNVSIAVDGMEYRIGDIVEVILTEDDIAPLTSDTEKVLLQITEVDEFGRVISLKPFMDYALPYKIWGIRNTNTLVGKGYGLRVDCFSYELTLSDSTLSNDENSAVSQLPQFDENDMFKFAFDNIYDLDITYEVFVGGKQITNFVVRHNEVSDPLKPKNIDVLYLNANDVIGLKNSSIYIPAEHYFIYRIDNVVIRDPGAGYCVGQDIFVDADQIALKLQVAKLVLGPHKGIEIAELSDSKTLYEGIDPSIENAEVVTDSLNNIDDEYNVGYYDKIPIAGIVKPLTKSYDADEFPMTVKRFDNMDGDDRNKSYMYPNVNRNPEYPQNGDPDYNWYQGSRIDNSYIKPLTSSEITDLWKMEDNVVWNGIMNVVPPTDPFIPDAQRTPDGQPVKGEYHLIQSLRIHSSDAGDYVDMVPLTVPELEDIWYDLEEPDDYDHDQYNKTGVRQINEPEVTLMWDGQSVDENNPGNERIRLKAITPLEVLTMWRGGTVQEEDDEIIRGDIFTDATSVFDFSVESMKNAAMIDGDMTVEHFSDLPRHVEDFPDGKIGKIVIVEEDETCNNHRTMYRIRTFVAAGFFVYDLPEIADYSWNEFNVNWMNSEWLVDFPTAKAQYPTAPWDTAPTYRKVMHAITDGIADPTHVPEQYNNTTFITSLTVDDISVYNWSLHKWEDLHDESRWKLITYHDDEKQKWGFTLRFLQSGTYSYDMRLYLNKTPNTQMKNAELKRNATMDISAIIHSEVNKAAMNMSVNTGRHLRIRKLFPYEQKESYTLGFAEDGEPLGYKMDFKLAPYMHYKNQIHLEDIKVYNKTAGRFENVLDPAMFEVQFKDPKAVARGFETQTRIVQALIGDPGQGFVDGDVWAWNREHQIHVFGRVTADFLSDGHLITFTPVHCPNPPTNNISLEFEVFQNANQSDVQKAIVMIEFVTEKLEVYGDGYIHNVTNRLAPVPEEFRVIVQYDLEGIGEYDIIIAKSSREWTFREPNWLMAPTFHIDDYNISADRLYVLTDKGRFPMVNPSTGKPTLHVTEVENGTDVMFLNLYRRYQKFNLHAVPYPARSVYVQRKIPSNGFIDLTGKINKPLNKKYFEFWVNGKLLYDEVTIISPTKIFLHGLKSLKNLEILEINRDSNEYFSDGFLDVTQSELGRPYQSWDYLTYLDDALTGTLEGDNYTTEEQEYLLSPVWPQVDETHPEYKNYPPNVDIEDDILLMISTEDGSIEGELENPVYQFLIIDPPTIEGKPIFEQNVSFEHFGLIPISDEMIVDMLNEEWAEEIRTDPYVNEHFVISDDEWYGTTARLYDEYGIQVHTLNEAAYNVHDSSILQINAKNKVTSINKIQKEYDLT